MHTLKKLFVPAVLGIAGLMLFSSCTVGLPDGATAVTNFKKDKFLGKWYEIARFDYRFEKNLNNVTATRFVKDENTAELKVSFFKPIWSGYNVIDIDEDYQYALIAGYNLDYLWILSRETTIPEDIKQRFLKKAQSLGYDTGKLIWVEHNKTK